MPSTMSWAWILAILAIAAAKEQTRWSRQISSYTADIGDWVPLPGPVVSPDQTPVKRQAIAQPRILAEPFPAFPRPIGFQEAFPPRNLDFPTRNAFNNRQYYLSSVPSAPQNFLTEQGFAPNIRFNLNQPNNPLAQGFVAPQMGFDNPAPIYQINKQRGQNTVSFPKSDHPVSPQAKPFVMPPQKPIGNPVKYVDGYRVDNSSFPFIPNKKKPSVIQTMQKVKFESKILDSMISKPKSEREEVQLLYVPMDSLNRNQYSFKSPIQQFGDPNIYSQVGQKQQQIPEYRPISNPVEKFSFGQDYFNNYNTNHFSPNFDAPSQVKEYDQVPKFSTIATPFPTIPPVTSAPKKLKPHQPPLAIFLTYDAKKGDKVKVGDVLTSLKNANTISVLDSVNPDSAPKVFIGPSTLQSPMRYVKFDLPYLSNIEHSDKKLRQLPFFVAPLSYKTPDGFAKIPFPSPHVGSVIVNAQIRDSSASRPLAAEVTPNAYTASPPVYKEQTNQKPSVSYYSTAAPITNPPPNKQQQNNYYNVEQQRVNFLKNKPTTAAPAPPPPPKKSTYFVSNDQHYQEPTYTSDQHGHQGNVQYDNQRIKDNYNVGQHYQTTAKTTSTQPSTRYTTTQQVSTYPSQLLETHNPYSINQAFHLSTPLDFNHEIEENKEGFSTQTPQKPTQATTAYTKDIITERPQFVPQTANYLQNYSPEIHYESDHQSSRYPQYHAPQEQDVRHQQPPTYNYPSTAELAGNEYGNVGETHTANSPNPQNDVKHEEPTISHDNNEHNTDYNYESKVQSPEATTSTTTTTTTRRSPIRNRGRPRTTTPKPDSGEDTTRASTRRPLRERRPLPQRPKYEPNKITTEKPERPSRRQPVDNSEATTRANRSKTRGRVQYKVSEHDSEGNRKSSSKEQDLAYQRDVLHQNYPVTLMERMSTVDIEAITEPVPRISSTRNLPTSQVPYDTENAYSNEYSISSNGNTVETYTNRPEVETTAYASRISSPEYSFHPRSSPATEASPTYASSSTSHQEDDSYYTRSSTTSRPMEVAPLTTQAPIIEELNRYLAKDDYSSPPVVKDESSPLDKEESTTPETTYESSKNTETEPPVEESPQTTPIYNRVRVRPGGLRPYAQRPTLAPSTTSRAKTEERRRPQAVTYRPAFDKRRTTMRIDEIEADLKTKQIRTRPDNEQRHPVYRPDPTTESPNTTPVQESKRGQFRRRRPSYATSSTTTENTVARKINSELKNRFRGRRPTDKSTMAPEATTETPAVTTTRTVPYSRFTRPKLSERYNKKPAEETEDQETNYSINRPTFVPFDENSETEQWSSKYTSDFKPYNPNDIVDDQKSLVTEHHLTSTNDNEGDIITARNDYDEILVSVTPASNKLNKKISDIPPTLEALVEQTKVTNTEGGEMSTFETMLEEVMKNLEEQDSDEYTTNVQKHKGGEIGEIPPENVVSDGDRITTVVETEITTSTPEESSNSSEEKPSTKPQRRGYWKKVHKRPVTPEAIDVAESQYYTETVNHLGTPAKHVNQYEKYENLYKRNEQFDKYGQEIVKNSSDKDLDSDSNGNDKQTDQNETQTNKNENQSDQTENFYDQYDTSTNGNPSVNKAFEKSRITTYKPRFSMKDLHEAEDEELEAITNREIPKLSVKPIAEATKPVKETVITDPSEVDLGTGAPETMHTDMFYTPTSTEPTSEVGPLGVVDRSDGYSFMDFLFGITSEEPTESDDGKEVNSSSAVDETTISNDEGAMAEDNKSDDVAEGSENGNNNDSISTVEDNAVKDIENVSESSTESTFMDSSKVMSTSMSTEVSHETEICFRGKCIKTKRNIL